MRLDEMQARVDAADPAPWEYVPATEEVVSPEGGLAEMTWPGRDEPNATFIAHARQDVPALIAALRAVLALHERVETYRVEPRTFERIPVPEGICGECSDERDAIWPCSTVRAVTSALEVTR